jgi:hypothetical protein
MTETLLYILCWIGVVYFMLHFCKLIVLIGKGFVSRQKSMMRKQHASRKPRTRNKHHALSSDPTAY